MQALPLEIIETVEESKSNLASAKKIDFNPQSGGSVEIKLPEIKQRASNFNELTYQKVS
jgi:hypothetical protein